jgi:V/A-type H+/Na+-transporting ATPase subunit C
MDIMQFTQTVSRIRVLETRLLDRGKLERMIDSGSAEEALRVLQETEYSVYMSGLRRAEDFELILREELRRIYHLLYEITPLKEVVDILSLRYDYHNLKVLVKGKFLSKDLSYLLIPVGAEEFDKLKNSIINESYRDMNPLMREAVEKAIQEFELSKDPQSIDLLMDRYMLKHMLLAAERVDNKLISKYVVSNIDLTNIRTLIRARQQNKNKEFLNKTIIEGGLLDRDRLNSLFMDSVENIPGKLSYTDYSEILRLGVESYAESGTVNVLEKLSDNFLMNIVRDAKFVSFGPEPLLAYLVAKETEIKVIRIIMVGKINKVSPELIRERLRDIYV